MRSLLTTVLLLFLATIATLATANADQSGSRKENAVNDRIIILPADMTKSNAQIVGERIIVLFEQLKPGDRLQAITAGGSQTIFDARVPYDKVYERHAGHRRKVVMPEFHKLQTYLTEAIAKSEDHAKDEPYARADLPGTFEALAYHAARGAEIVIFGNPIHYDPRTPDHSMVTAYPTDGHFLRSREITPFGIAGRENTLGGMRIHVCITQAEWINDAHREGVYRTYARMAERLGGQLATFSDDLVGCFERFVSGETTGARDFATDPIDDRFAMIDVTLPPVPSQNVPGSMTAASSAASVPQTVARSPLTAALEREIAEGITEMRTLRLYDTDVEDGDVVKIVGTGFSKIVALFNTPQKVRVPVTRGALRVVGFKDGRGGITVGIRTESGKVLISQEIVVDESVEIPIR